MAEEESLNSTILLQEVPNSAVNRLEQELNLQCTWNNIISITLRLDC